MADDARVNGRNAAHVKLEEHVRRLRQIFTQGVNAQSNGTDEQPNGTDEESLERKQ
jgi:hypothetical protein